MWNNYSLDIHQPHLEFYHWIQRFVLLVINVGFALGVIHSQDHNEFNIDDFFIKSTEDLIAAQSFYDQQLLQDQLNAHHYLARAKIKVLRGLLSYAVVDLRVALIFSPDFEPAAEELVVLLCRLREYRRAHELATKMFQILPHEPSVRFELWSGIAAHFLALEEIAQFAFERVITRNPEEPLGYYYKALSFLATRNFQSALQYLNEAIRQETQNPEFLSTRAFTRLAQFIVQRKDSEPIPPHLYTLIRQDLDQIRQIRPLYYDPRCTEILLNIANNQGENAIETFLQLPLPDEVDLLGAYFCRLFALQKFNLFPINIDKDRIYHFLRTHRNMSHWLYILIYHLVHNQPLSENLLLGIDDVYILAHYWLHLGFQLYEKNPKESQINFELASLRPTTFESMIATLFLQKIKTPK